MSLVNDELLLSNLLDREGLGALFSGVEHFIAKKSEGNVIPLTTPFLE